MHICSQTIASEQMTANMIDRCVLLCLCLMACGGFVQSSILEEAIKNIEHIMDFQDFHIVFNSSLRELQPDQLDSSIIEGKRKKSKTTFFNRIAPLLILPYLVQSAFLPIILVSIKLLLLKTIFIGKLAILLGVYNALRSRLIRNNMKENENMDRIIKEQYGYMGTEEYGAWIN